MKENLPTPLPDSHAATEAGDALNRPAVSEQEADEVADDAPESVEAEDADSPAETVAQPATADALLRLMGQDARVGHFIVDILAGVAPKEASRARFDIPVLESPSAETALAEAEQRGYLRGRNERISIEMERPALWEDRNATAVASDIATDGPMILSSTSRSVWD